MESEWVKLLFRERMVTWENAEDWQLCMNARKYANIRCFTMPVHPSDTSTNSFTLDYLQISDRGDTTLFVPGANDARGLAKKIKILRGDRSMFSYTSSSSNSKPLMVFAETNYDALLILNALQKVAFENLDVYFSVSSAKKSQINLDELKSKYKIKSYNDFMIGSDFDSEISSVAQAAETMYHFDMSIQQTQSTSLIIVQSLCPSTLAVLAVAEIRKIPIIRFVVNSQNASFEFLEPRKIFNIHINSNRELNNFDISKLNKLLTIFYK